MTTLLVLFFLSLVLVERRVLGIVFTIPVEIDGEMIPFITPDLDPLCEPYVDVKRVTGNAVRLVEYATEFVQKYSLVGEQLHEQLILAAGQKFLRARLDCTFREVGHFMTVPLPTKFQFDVFINDPGVAGTFVSQRIADSSEWEPTKSRVVWQRISRAAWTMKVAAKRPLFLDIGAHIGWYSLLAVAAGGDAVSFEPSVINRERFKASIEYNNMTNQITLHPYALGETSGQSGCHKYIAGEIIDSWSKDNDNDTDDNHKSANNQKIQQCTGRQSGKGSVVQISTVDALLETDASVFAMKIDTEGFETMILRGATKLFHSPSRSPCVVFIEYMPNKTSTSFGEKRHELFANMTELYGYQAYAIPELWEMEASMGVAARRKYAAGTPGAVPVTMDNISTMFTHDLEFVRYDGRCELLMAKDSALEVQGPGITWTIDVNTGNKEDEGENIGSKILPLLRHHITHEDATSNADPAQLAKDYCMLHGLASGLNEAQIKRKLNEMISDYVFSWK